MFTLITGGSKCGKSHIAEHLLENVHCEKIYIATMIPYGKEAHAAIERHRVSRAGKNFVTIEKYTNINELNIPERSVVLIECIANLCANEMFDIRFDADVSDRIVNAVKKINKACSHLVVVTNDVSRDGIKYTEETQLYIKNLCRINRQLALIADNVIECVYGIPVILKGEL